MTAAAGALDGELQARAQPLEVALVEREGAPLRIGSAVERWPICWPICDRRRWGRVGCRASHQGSAASQWPAPVDLRSVGRPMKL